MYITRETDYAIRCVLQLATAPDRVAVVGELAEADDVPRSFLAKILQKLARAGIVRSHRGVQGGFQLARDPAQLSLLDVVEAMEGPVSLSRCVVEEDFCDRRAFCVVHPLWTKMRLRYVEMLRRHSFQRLAQLEKRRLKSVRKARG